MDTGSAKTIINPKFLSPEILSKNMSKITCDLYSAANTKLNVIGKLNQVPMTFYDKFEKVYREVLIDNVWACTNIS